MLDITLTPEQLATVHTLHSHLRRVARGEVRESTLPDALLDGTPITSVTDLATATGKTLLGASVLALNNGILVEEAKDLYQRWATPVVLAPPPASDAMGVALMLKIPEDTDIPGSAVPPEDRHITILYIGDGSLYEDIDEFGAMFTAYAREVARQHLPFDVSLNSVTRFSTPNDSGMDPVVVNADAPELEDLRRTAIDMLQDSGIPNRYEQTHGYTPHMTLGYLPEDAENPFDRWEPFDVRVTEIIAGVGGEHRVVALGDGTATKDVYHGEGSVPITANTSNRVRRSGRPQVLNRARRCRLRIKNKKKRREP